MTDDLSCQGLMRPNFTTPRKATSFGQAVHVSPSRVKIPDGPFGESDRNGETAGVPGRGEGPDRALDPGAGETTVAEAAERAKVSAQSIGNWNASSSKP